MLSLPFLIALVIIAGLVGWPGVGAIARWRESRRRRERIRREDALKHVLKCEVNGQLPTLNSVANALTPGIGTTGCPDWRTAATKTAPGSDKPGVPASVQ